MSRALGDDTLRDEFASVLKLALAARGARGVGALMRARGWRESAWHAATCDVRARGRPRGG